MKYSVLVPVYNCKNRLNQCIDSVLQQTYPNWELILVDDGSSDGSEVICDFYQERYPQKISVIHQKNGGTFHARRVAMEQSRGEYVCFLDADDYWDSRLLEKLEFFRGVYQPDIIFFGFRSVDSQGMVLNENRPYSEIKEITVNEKSFIYEKVGIGQFTSLCTQTFRRTLIDFDQDYSSYYHVFKGEDRLQNLVFIDVASSILLVPDIYYYYFNNSEGVTNSKVSVSYLQNHIFVQEKVLEYMKKWHMNTDNTYQMFSRIFYLAIGVLMRDRIGKKRIYSKADALGLIGYLTSGRCNTYLGKLKLDWKYKRFSVGIFLMKRHQLWLLWPILSFFRILHEIKLVAKG